MEIIAVAPDFGFCNMEQVGAFHRPRRCLLLNTRFSTTMELPQMDTISILNSVTRDSCERGTVFGSGLKSMSPFQLILRPGPQILLVTRMLESTS